MALNSSAITEKWHPASHSGYRFVAEPEAPSVSRPWSIEYIIADLDGTLVNTYVAFRAAELLASHFHEYWPGLNKSRDQIVKDLAFYINKYAAVEDLLHDPEATLFKIAKFYAWHENRIFLPPHSRDKPHSLTSAFEECFALFPEVKDFLVDAKNVGTAVSLYTNTNPQNTVRRLIKAGITPDLVHYIWTKTKKPEELLGVFDWPMTEKEKAFVKKLRPYDQAKPNPMPFIRIKEWYDIAPENILMIGEGIADLGSVLEDPSSLDQQSRFHTRFAFQKAGASATEPHTRFNQTLRKDHPLGLDSFEKKYPQATDHPGVLVLHDGFKSVRSLIDERAIRLIKTPEPQLDFVSGHDSDQPQLRQNLASRLATRAPRFGLGEATAS